MDFDDFFDEKYDYEIEGQGIHSVDSEFSSSKGADESENGLQAGFQQCNNRCPQESLARLSSPNRNSRI